MPTGATVAALTTSLPETPGGERNWDYRYTWLRDSTFTLQALHYLNLDWEAEEFMQFAADLEPNEDGALQIMYAIDGRRDLTESTRDDLSGYAGASPVRIGNGAFDQRQNDVYGAALDAILLHTRRSQRLPRRLWPIIQAQAECATAVWREPDQGIWEARGDPKHYVSSKLMGWVAMDRAAQLAGMRGDKGREATWRATAEEIRADILSHGVSDRGVLRQHYETDALDASNLLAAIFGFLPGDDERLRASVLAIAEDLTEDGFVLRYRTDETDDGMSGKEGSFLICSFWLVSGLAIIGEQQRARDLMEKLLSVASPLGLYAEEFDTSTGRHLGNFPQAFSHLALIEAAGRIILAERIARSDRGRLRRHRHRQRRGRRHARASPGAVGQAHPAARARRLAAPRATELARAGRLRGRPLPCPPRRGTTTRTTPFQPQVHYYVGGATKLYGAALYRLREQDFGELRHHDGISPAWPIAYEQMEPYYTQAEHLYRVHGARGEDPTEPPTSAPYAFPAVSHEPRIQQLADDLAAIGHHPFHAPCGVMLDEANMPYSACVRCRNCDGFPCLVHAKSDAETIAVRPAIEHENVTLLRNAEAVALRTNPAGNAVTEVLVERDGQRETFTADIVVVSCGAANSAKLLLASANEHHPHGLANGSDQLGRNYMFHNSVAVLALSRGAEPDGVPEDARAQRLLLLGPGVRLPARQHPDGRQVPGADVPRREAAGDQARSRMEPRGHRQARRRLLALERGPAGRREPRDAERRRSRQALLQGDQRGAPQAPLPAAALDARPAGNAPDAPHPASRLPAEPDSRGGRRPPGGDMPLRQRPAVLGAGRRLQGARARQPVRRRHELLPEHRRRQPGIDGDGQRSARRRPPAGAARRATNRTRGRRCRLRQTAGAAAS